MSHRKDMFVTVILILLGVLILPRIIEKSSSRMDKIETVNYHAYEKVQAVENELKNAEERLGVVLKKDTK